jgi:SAM-dependent methyltransferase
LSELINTYSDPNEQGWNRVSTVRIAATLDFLKTHGRSIHGKVLDIGWDSPMSRAISDMFPVELVHTSKDCDLDFDDLVGQWDHIFSFEVIEHLGNPLRHLAQLRDHLNPGGAIWLSTPLATSVLRPTQLVRNKHHLFEMDRRQLLTLIHKAGLEVVQQRTCGYLPWWKSLLGVRTIIRTLTTSCILLQMRPRAVPLT